MKHSTRMLASELGLKGSVRLEFIDFVECGRAMPNSLYSELFKALMPKMPYEVAKGKTADPERWIIAWVHESISSSQTVTVPSL